MVRSVIVAFDGKGLVLGNATARLPTMRVRVRVLSGSVPRLHTRMEIEGAGPAAQAIVQGLATRYDTVIEPQDSGPGWWHGHVTYRDPAQLRGHPAYDAILDFVGRMTGAALWFEGGTAFLRLDPRDARTAEDIEAALAAWAGDIDHRVLHVELADLEDWRPGPELEALRRETVPGRPQARPTRRHK